VASFDELIAEADAAPIRGWDFSWLDGRATEERPPWGYARLVGERAARAARHLDLQTGGGEVLAGVRAPAPFTVATEGWLPNARAAANKHIRVVAAPNDALPFPPASFDLVTSRHPVDTPWGEIGRVLQPGGTFLSQQVGPRSVAELTEYLTGPQGESGRRDPERHRALAETAGLRVDDLRTARLRMAFDDVGAVVYFLRLVIWIVPGFSTERYRARLLALHQQIERNGPFVAHSTRFLIEATKPV
jgi:SAM-dependent methyltransferase